MAKVKIDKEKCIGCGACVNTCPQNVFEMNDENKAEAVNESDCIACRACENACPVDAITIEEE
ncbi:MAG: 4Fe-4S dicluster domain-containing protein [Nanoarchaeota archaeon]